MCADRPHQTNQQLCSFPETHRSAHRREVTHRWDTSTTCHHLTKLVLNNHFNPKHVKEHFTQRHVFAVRGAAAILTTSGSSSFSKRLFCAAFSGRARQRFYSQQGRSVVFLPNKVMQSALGHLKDTGALFCTAEKVH